MPLMVAIIGGEPRRFRPLVDLYRETGRRHGYTEDRLVVGVHSPGYVARRRRRQPTPSSLVMPVRSPMWARSAAGRL